MKVLELVKANYDTYKILPTGAAEKQWIRLVISFLVSLLLAIFAGDVSSAYPIMVTVITILTGFTFTALFSDHILADVGLPTPSNENDRKDIERLELLSENFKTRSSYFILLSIIDAVLLIAASLKFTVPRPLSNEIDNMSNSIITNFGLELPGFISLISNLFSELIFVMVALLFLECLYTFYRLSETIIAIVDIRSTYLKAANRSEKP